MTTDTFPPDPARGRAHIYRLARVMPNVRAWLELRAAVDLDQRQEIARLRADLRALRRGLRCGPEQRNQCAVYLRLCELTGAPEPLPFDELPGETGT